MLPGNTIHPPGLEGLALAIVKQAKRDLPKPDARDFLVSLVDLVRPDLKGRL